MAVWRRTSEFKKQKFRVNFRKFFSMIYILMKYVTQQGSWKKGANEQTGQDEIIRTPNFGKSDGQSL